MEYNISNSPSKNFSIETIQENDIDYILKMCVKLFSEAVNYNYPEYFFYCNSDFSISKKAVLNGKIIGCYLLNDVSITSYDMNRLEDLEPYESKNSLQGVALGLQKEYRGLSYGRQLRDSALSLIQYDYIWGFHEKTLNNLGNWLKYGRRLVGDIESSYVTLMDMNNNV